MIETDAALERVAEREDEDRCRSSSPTTRTSWPRLRARPTRRARRSPRRRARLARTKLYAPIDGVVQQTVGRPPSGRSSRPGSSWPSSRRPDGKLQVEALVANLDIGFVKVGQEAVESRSTPSRSPVSACCTARSSRSPPAAIDEQEAKRALANATAPGQRRPTPAAAPGQPESFVFPVTVALDETAMRVDGAIDPADARHDRHGRHQDRHPAGDRLPPVAARQDDVGGDDRKVANLERDRTLERAGNLRAGASTSRRDQSDSIRVGRDGAADARRGPTSFSHTTERRGRRRRQDLSTKPGPGQADRSCEHDNIDAAQQKRAGAAGREKQDQRCARQCQQCHHQHRRRWDSEIQEQGRAGRDFPLRWPAPTRRRPVPRNRLTWPAPTFCADPPPLLRSRGNS